MIIKKTFDIEDILYIGISLKENGLSNVLKRSKVFDYIETDIEYESSIYSISGIYFIQIFSSPFRLSDLVFFKCTQASFT